MGTTIIEYDVTEAVLTELRNEQEIVLQNPKNIEKIKSSKRKIGKLRIAIEKRRKEYKAEALAYGRNVDRIALKSLSIKPSSIYNFSDSRVKKAQKAINLAKGE